MSEEEKFKKKKECSKSKSLDWCFRSSLKSDPHFHAPRCFAHFPKRPKAELRGERHTVVGTYKELDH